MTNNGYNNGHAANDDYAGFTYELEEPIAVKGFSVTYDRKFNTGNFESLNPAITIWVKSAVPEGEAFDLHHAKERVRRMARENVRAQLLRLQGNPEVVFLGLQPPLTGDPDPIFVRTVSVSLTYKVNLGDYNSITPGYTDWHDVRHVAHSPGELHMALDRMWQNGVKTRQGVYYAAGEERAYDEDSPPILWQIGDHTRLYAAAQAARLSLRFKGQWQPPTEDGGAAAGVAEVDEAPDEIIDTILGNGRSGHIEGSGPPAQAFQQIWDRYRTCPGTLCSSKPFRTC